MRDIRYEKVSLGTYKHQVTVTEYPSKIAKLFGAKPSERVFLSECAYSDGLSIWYEVPTMERLSMWSDGLEDAIRCVIRQQFVTGETT